LLISAVNLILPIIGIIYIYGIDIRTLGPSFSLVMLGFISYAIIKHRFMDIRLAFRKNLSNFITALLMAILSIFVVRVLFQWNSVYSTITSELIIAYIVFVSVLGLPSIKDRIRFLIDKFFYKGVADYHTLMVNSTKELSSVLDMGLFLDNLINNIVSYMKLDFAFYSIKDFSHNYNTKGFFSTTEELTESIIDTAKLNSVIKYIEKTRPSVVLVDLLKRPDNQTEEILYNSLKNMKVEVLLPLVAEDCLEGIMLLGAKQSGEPYYHEDLSLLSTITTQVTIGLINEKHYNEISRIRFYQENVLSEMGNGLIAVNDKGMITVYNSEAEKLLGIPIQDAVGKELFYTFGEDLYQLFYKTLSVNTGVSQHEISINTRGVNQYISCNTSLIQAPDRNLNEVIIVLSDITRIKNLESEKLKSQRLISLGEVAAGIAHEIKNPLVSIKTFADLLPDKYNDDEFRHIFSNVVSQEITRINDLVGELLNFVKEPVLTYEQFDIKDLIEELVTLLSPQLEEQKVTMEFEFPETPQLFLADRSLLKQALLNILLNSIQAMPDGGKMIVGALFSDTNLIVYIEDTGIGISGSIRDKIFDPFVTDKADGVGLGLSICHKIISAHRGSINLKSEEGTGSRFEIVLPCSQA